MAFNAPASNNAQPTLGASNNRWQADAYINLYIPVTKSSGEGQTKLCSAKLRLDQPIHARLIDMFREDPEGAGERLKNALIVHFNEANSSEAELLI